MAVSKSWLKEKWFLLWHAVAVDEHRRRCEREIELIELERRLKMTSTMTISRLMLQTCFDQWRQGILAWKLGSRERPESPSIYHSEAIEALITEHERHKGEASRCRARRAAASHEARSAC